MKKLCIVCFSFVAFAACNNSSSDSAGGGDTTSESGLTNPTAIDTTKHPTGVDNSSVISTDTAAMNTSNAYKKADSAQQSKQ
jgi:hypothetical protein